MLYWRALTRSESSIYEKPLGTLYLRFFECGSNMNDASG